MIEYFQNNLWQLWTLVGILCLILELTSGDFFIMCFSIGAFVTAIVAAFVPSFTVQVIVFAVASLLCLLFVRPLALKYFHRKDPDRPSVEVTAIDSVIITVIPVDEITKE